MENHVRRAIGESLSEQAPKVMHHAVGGWHDEVAGLANPLEPLQEILTAPADVLEVINEKALD